MNIPGDGLGYVKTHTVDVCQGGLPLDGGGEPRRAVTVAEQYGELNAARDNVILACHALSGSTMPRAGIVVRQSPAGGTS